MWKHSMGAAQVGAAGFRKSAQGVVQKWQQKTPETWWVGSCVYNNTYDTTQRCGHIQWGPHKLGLQDVGSQHKVLFTNGKTHQKLGGQGALC
jgi:hypothetical protein